jgi:2-isopropylmalate synthase
VGYVVPDEYAALIAHLKAKCKPVPGIIFSTHCHNDLGLATANTLAAVQAGARQVEVTLNSLGERAGNTSLEEVVMAVRTRPNHYPVHVAIDTTQVRARGVRVGGERAAPWRVRG